MTIEQELEETKLKLLKEVENDVPYRISLELITGEIIKSEHIIPYHNCYISTTHDFFLIFLKTKKYVSSFFVCSKTQAESIIVNSRELKIGDTYYYKNSIKSVTVERIK